VAAESTEGKRERSTDKIISKETSLTLKPGRS
jgi:hypothetical protein